MDNEIDRKIDVTANRPTGVWVRQSDIEIGVHLKLRQTLFKRLKIRVCDRELVPFIDLLVISHGPTEGQIYIRYLDI